MDRVIIKTAKPLSELDEKDWWAMRQPVIPKDEAGEGNPWFNLPNYIKDTLTTKDKDETLQTIEMFQEHIIKNGQVDIYRAMKVDNNFINNLNQGNTHLGIWWTWDEDSAKSYWAKFQKTPKPFSIILHSIIREEYINWTETIIINKDDLWADEINKEKEITLFDGTPLQILNIDILEGAPQINADVYQITYYA